MINDKQVHYLEHFSLSEIQLLAETVSDRLNMARRVHENQKAYEEVMGKVDMAHFLAEMPDLERAQYIISMYLSDRIGEAVKHLLDLEKDVEEHRPKEKDPGKEPGSGV